MVDLSNIEKQLEDEFGQLGINYLFPQLDVIRSARNLASNIEDARLMTEKFFLSYKMIEQWLAPVIVPINDNLFGLESHLRDLQSQIKHLITEEEIIYWKDVANSENASIKSLFSDIDSLRKYILDQRAKLLQSAHRHELPELFGLVLWPYTEYTDVKDAVNDVRKIYFGPNNSYRKQNLLTDALILTALSEDVLTHKSQTRQSFHQIDSLIETSLTFRRVEEQFEWSKYQRDPSDGQFNEGQVFSIMDNLMPGYPRDELRKGLNTFYDSSLDKYPIGKFIAWLSDIMRMNTMAKSQGEDRPGELRLKKEHLLGLSIMDKHRNSEVLGNIGDLQGTFERILAPFHELKQNNVFMQSSQFVIDNVLEIPSRAWIYDYSGVETEILRSTLFMLSDRQPKFDVLEICQKLSNIVLSGRVNRNDLNDGNYVLTNKLSVRLWDYISNQLMKLLEETLIHEEIQSVRLLKSIFSSEDTTSLITAKKFAPVYQVNIDFKRGISFDEKGVHPETLSIWIRSGFPFEYRYAQMAGYPWFFDTNLLLESLVIEALSLPSFKVSSLHENVKLRQAVFMVDDLTYIIYYDTHPEGISALAFKEVDIMDEAGIDPVEIIYRPHKYLSLGPEKNNLHLVLDNARAKDPKDLMTVISNIKYKRR
ncbi:hypothetical protein CEE45_13125 [Candidatus Heimdallarchaeota archaeon B3_Heim]|nr:MAG: hypothetical protein CEE45_13125 [Candidatus Heimdallarchaeota archaeon B3_Heim]